MFQNRRDYPATITDRCERANKRIFQQNILTDNGWATHSAVAYATARSELYAPNNLALRIDFALDTALDPLVQNDSVRGQQIVLLSCIEPPCLDAVAQNLATGVEQRLYCIGDLKLTAR